MSEELLRIRVENTITPQNVLHDEAPAVLRRNGIVVKEADQLICQIPWLFIVFVETCRQRLSRAISYFMIISI